MQVHAVGAVVVRWVALDPGSGVRSQWFMDCGCVAGFSGVAGENFDDASFESAFGRIGDVPVVVRLTGWFAPANGLSFDVRRSGEYAAARVGELSYLGNIRGVYVIIRHGSEPVQIRPLARSKLRIPHRFSSHAESPAER